MGRRDFLVSGRQAEIPGWIRVTDYPLDPGFDWTVADTIFIFVRFL